MNQTQPYMDVHSSHLSSAQSYAPQGATAGNISHYPQYQQPPVLQPGSTTYAPPSSSYPSYGYPNGVTSPQSGSQPVSTAMNSQVPAQLLPLPAMTTSAAGPPGYAPGPPSQPYSQHPLDTTGQVAPPGMKPRVTATLWEDEGSLCFQVEAKGVCVARREDNHMINGTKLLNVAGMTRGRRDGILKSEKIRHVVKIGPMHLKGVWIPFERALDFANKEKITEQLYPLFVHNIGGLLYHPTNQNRTNAIVAASERRRLEGNQTARTPQGSQPPTLHHHHSMHNPPTASHMTQPPHSIAPHPAAGRPGLDRAHTFPTPPTSASSLIGIPNQGSSYEWGAQSMGNSVQGSQPLSIDTGLSNTRSMPTTPATTPPGTNMQNMQPYQGQPGYDSSKSYYSAAPSSQAQYAPQQPMPQQQQGMARYGQPIPANPYMKNEMGPPSGRSTGSEPQHADAKADQYSHSQGNVQVGHGTGEGEADNEHEAEYINDNAAYNTNRGSYTYTANPPVGAISGEHSHLSPEITGSPSHPNNSGRGTPRTTSGSQAQWASGYHTPPRAPPSCNVFHVMSDTRGSGTNGNVADAYSTSSAAPAYPAPSMNGNSGSNKRGRDEDDGDQLRRPDAHDAEVATYEHKRRKTLDASIGGPVRGAPLGVQGMKPGIVSRRR